MNPPAFHGDDGVALAQLELLTRTLEDAVGEGSLAPLLTRIIEGACLLIGAGDGVIGLYAPEHDAIVTAATYRTPPGALRDRVGRGEGLMGRVLEIDAPIRCRYGDLPLPVRAQALDQEALGVPIRVHGRLIGVFCVGVDAPRMLAPNAQPLLELYARHAALAISSAQRYEAEQRRASRFSLIARIAALVAAAPEVEHLLQRAADAIHELLDFDNVDIPLVDPDDSDMLVIRIRGGGYKERIRHVDRLPIGQGIMGAAAAERATQVVNNVQADPRYVTPPGVEAPHGELAVPIMHGDELFGVLNVEGRTPFDDLDRVSMEVIAEHLAMAMAHARLFDAARDAALLGERHRLARDLHDNVTQILSSMNLLTQSLAAAWREDPDAAMRRVDRLGELSRLALGEMRAMLEELSPDGARLAATVTLPIDRRMRQLLGAMVPPYVRVAIDVEPMHVRPATQEAVLRICQEAVSNSVRHGAPDSVEVSVRVVGSRLCIVVADDGRGISASAPRGMGLLNMRQRVAEMNGRLRIARRVPQGTLVVAWLPLDAKKS